LITDIYKEKRHELAVNGEQFLINSEQLNAVMQIVSVNNEMLHVLSEQIESFNIPKLHAYNLSRIILSSVNSDDAVNYLFDRRVTLDDINRRNLFDVFLDYNIGEDLISDLMRYTWEATPAIGKGEVFFALMFKDASKINDHGDVIIGDEVVDIKGDGARLKGQTGFGMGHEAGDFWHGILSSRDVFNQYATALPAKGSTAFNLTSGNFALDRLGRVVGFTIDDVIDLWKQGLMRVYDHSSYTDFKFIDRAYETGKLDEEKLRLGFIKFSIRYYFKVEQVDKIVVSKFSLRESDTSIDSKRIGYVAILSKNDVLTDEYIQSIAKYTLPSFSASAGSQGGALGISIKALD
jgi:hypothetical protein